MERTYYAVGTRRLHERLDQILDMYHVWCEDTLEKIAGHACVNVIYELDSPDVYLDFKKRVLSHNPLVVFKLVSFQGSSDADLPELVHADENLHYHLTTNVLHVIYTRFMIVTDQWLSRGYTKAHLLSDAHLTPRLESMRLFYKPWVVNQTRKNFLVVIIIDEDLSRKHIETLMDIFHDLKNVVVVKFNETLHKSISWNRFLEHSTELAHGWTITDNEYVMENFLKVPWTDATNEVDKLNIDYFITTRVDDDDMLPDWFCDEVQTSVTRGMQRDYMFYGFNHGYIFFSNDKVQKTTLMNEGAHSVGLTLIMRTRSNIKKYFNVFCSHHTSVKTWIKDNNTKDDLFHVVEDGDVGEYMLVDNTRPSYVYNRMYSFSMASFTLQDLTPDDRIYLKEHYGIMTEDS